MSGATTHNLLTRERALHLTESLGALTQMVSSVEYLLDRRNRAPGGLNHFASMQASAGIRSRGLRAAVDAVSVPMVTDAVHAGRVAAALAVILPSSRRVRFAANASLGASQFLMYPGMHYGTDGSDQASFITQVASTVARSGLARPALTDACLWYVAAQSALSYGVSGWSKVVSSQWRDGSALGGVMRTRSYGAEWAWQLTRRHPRLSHVLGSAVVAGEALFPLAVAGPGRRLAPLFVGAMASFHAANASVMGLNRFLPAFLSTHPAVLYVAGPRSRTGPSGVEHRDDLLPRAVAGLGVVGALATAVLHRRRSRRVARGRADEQTVRTRAGNDLRFRRTGEGAAEAPLLVCEAGLASTGEHWEWLARRLSARYPVITYHRAGYGSSVRARLADSGSALDIAVADLVDLVRDQAGERRVVLMGHSLGGYLVWRAVDQLKDRLDALVLLDSSHPGELESAESQASVERLDAVLRGTAAWLAVGLGTLVEEPPWMATMPADIRPLVHDQYAHPSSWTTARREWTAAKAAFAAGAPPLPDVPVYVATASKTAEDNAAQRALHEALAGGSARSQHHVVPRSNHESMITNPRTAAEVAASIDDFLTGLHGRPERAGAAGPPTSERGA